MSIIGDALAGGLGALDVRAREDRQRKAELQDKMTFQEFVLQKNREIKLLEMQDALDFETANLDQLTENERRKAIAGAEADVEVSGIKFRGLSDQRRAEFAEKLDQLSQMNEQAREDARLDLINELAMEAEFMGEKQGLASDAASFKRELMAQDATAWTNTLQQLGYGESLARDWAVQVATGVSNPHLSGTRNSNVNLTGLASSGAPSQVVRGQLGALLTQHMPEGDEATVNTILNGVTDAITDASPTKLREVLDTAANMELPQPVSDYLSGLRVIGRRFGTAEELKDALKGEDPALMLLLNNRGKDLIQLLGKNEEDRGTAAPRMEGRSRAERPMEEVLFEALDLMYVDSSE